MHESYLQIKMGARKKNPESAIRLNFLNQASHTILKEVPGGAGKTLAALMGHHMIMIGKKSQIRMESSIKRKICKVTAKFY